MPDDRVPDDRVPERSTADHDPAGGELARSLARAYRGGTADTRRRTSGGRGPTDGSGWSRRGTSARRATEAQLSGPGPDERDPQRLDGLLSRLVSEHGWANEVAVHGVFSRWDTLVGTEVAQHCRPEQFVDTRLVVRADSTAWATQMRLLAPTVLQRLDDEIGPGIVARIDVRGPQPPSWRHGLFTVRDGRGPRDTYG